MAEKLNFIVEFQAAQRSLRELRRAVESEFSKALKLDIETTGGPARGGAAPRQERGETRLLSDLARARQKSKEAEEKFVSATDKRVANTLKIIALQQRGIARTTEEDAQLQGLIRSGRSLKGSETKFGNALDKAESEISILIQEFSSLKAVAKAAGAGLLKVGESVFFPESAVRGFSGGLQILETLVSEVIRNVFVPLAQAGTPSTGIERALTELSSKITEEKDIFDKLGFNVKDGQKLLQAGFANFVESLRRAGINAVEVAQGASASDAPARPVDDTASRNQQLINSRSAVAAAAAQNVADTQARIAEINQEIINILAQRKRTEQAINNQANIVAGLEKQLSENINELAISTLDTSGVNADLQRAVENSARLASDNEALLERQKREYAQQTNKLESLTTVQQVLNNSVADQAAAARQAANLVRDQAALIASQGQGADLGPTGANTGLAEKELALAQQLEEGVAAVARFRAGLFGATESTEGYSVGARLFTRTVGEANRVLENAAVSQSVIAEELKEQASTIRTNSETQQRLGGVSIDMIEASESAAVQLETSAKNLEALSRPIVGVGARADRLGISLGTAASELAGGILPDATKQELVLAAQSFREIFAESGNDTKAAITTFVNEISSILTVSASPAEAFAILKASLKRASDKTIGLSDSADQLIAAERGAASNILEQATRLEIGEAQKDLRSSINIFIRELRGAGKEAAQLREDGTFPNFQDALEEVQRRFADALDPGQLSFLEQGAGVDLNRILEESLSKVAVNFESEFDRETQSIVKILDAEALRGAKELSRKLGDAAGIDIIDPDFINRAISRISNDFPRLGEEVIQQITEPLRRQARKAATERASVDSKIASIRQEEISAQEEAVERIRSSFAAQDLQQGLGGGALAQANEDVAAALKSAFGGLINKVRTDERKTLESALAREEVGKQIVDLLENRVSAENEALRAIRSQANAIGSESNELEQRSRLFRGANQRLINEIARLEAEVRQAEDSFNFEEVARLQGELADAQNQRSTNVDILVAIENRQRALAEQAANAAQGVAEKQLEISILGDEVVKEEANLARATKEAAEIARRRNRRAGGQGGPGDDRVGGGGPLQDFSVGSLRDFGQQLDLGQQAKFIDLLQKEDANLRTVNTQLKSHQGNIAKSNNLVDGLTASMNSGQKAAFQFGFAAANASDRLLAWASPAAFIFGAISSLREAVGTIIRLDSEIKRIAFFDSTTLDDIASQLRNVGDGITFTGQAAENSVGSFDRLNNVTERMAALNVAAAESQKVLIARARETGLELDQLAEIALVAGRVGRDAFQGGEVAPFAEAIEGLIRLEGAQANASELTAQLNSVLNQFNLEAQDATTIAAQLADASSRTGFSAAELAEGLTRVAGAFSTIQQATPAETLEFLTAAGNTAQTSVARVSTALRQLSVNVAEGAENIKEFADIDIVDEEGKLKGPEALVEVLKKINEFEGSDAAIEFITRFTDKRNAAIILSTARGVEGLEKNLKELAKEGGEANAALRAQQRFTAAVEDSSKSLNSEINKLRSGLVELVSRSGIIEFFEGIVKFGGRTVGIISDFTESIGGIGSIFTIIAGLALPTLTAIAQGFVAGLLPAQKQAEVISQIVVALEQEKNITDAVVKARAEGLLTEEKAQELAQRSLLLVTEEANLKIQIRTVEDELAVQQSSKVKDNVRIVELQLVEIDQANRLKEIQRETNALRQQTAGDISDPKLNDTFLGVNKQKLAGVASAALLLGGQKAASGIGKFIGEKVGKETGDSVEAALSGAVAGAAIGQAFGPVGAALGAVLAGTIALINKQQDLLAQKKKEAEEEEKILATIARQTQLKAIRDSEELKAKGRISAREKEILNARSALEDIDIRISAIGRERAEQEGLIEKSEKAQIGLNALLAQQKELQAEQLKQQVAFEEKIVRLKQQQGALSKINNLIGEAQIAILAEGTQAPVIEAQIKAKVDSRELDIQRRFLEDELTEVQSRLISVGVQTDSDQEVKKLEKRRIDVQRKISELEIADIETRFQSAKQILEAREQAADAELENFKSIGSFLNDAFQGLIDSQFRVVELIQQEGDVFKEIAEVQEEALDAASRGQRLGAVNDISDLSIREQQRIITRRNQIIEVGARRSVELLRRQFQEIGDIPTFEDLSGSAEDLQKKIADAGGPLAQFSATLTRGQRVVQAQIEVDKQLFETQRAQTLRTIDLRKTVLQQESDVSRQKIAIINDEIALIQQRLEKEAALGDKLLTAPDEFIKETRKILGAQEVIAAGEVDSSNVESALLKVISEINRTSGIAGLQQTLEGFKSAQERGVELVAGVLPAQLTSLFQRLVINPSAKLAKEEVSEQQKLISEMSNLFGQIEKNNQEQIKLLQEQEKIEALLRTTLPDLQKEQIAAIRGIIDTNLANAAITAAAAETAKTNFKGLATSINSLEGKLLQKINETDGDKKTIKAIESLKGVLDEIADASPDVQEARKNSDAIQRATERAQALLSGTFDKGLKDEFSRFSKIQINEAKKDSAELNAKLQKALGRQAEIQIAGNKLQQVNSRLFSGKTGGLSNLAGFGLVVDELRLAIARAGSSEAVVGEGILGGPGPNITTGRLSLAPEVIQELDGLKTTLLVINDGLDKERDKIAQGAKGFEEAFKTEELDKIRKLFKQAGLDFDKEFKDAAAKIKEGAKEALGGGEEPARAQLNAANATEEAARSTVRASNKAFTAACESLVATQGQQKVTAQQKEVVDQQLRANSELNNVTQQTRAVAAQQARGGINPITQSQIEIEEGLTGTLFNALQGFDFSEAFSRRVAAPGDEDFTSKFNAIVQEFGLSSDTLSQVAARVAAQSGGGREGFQQALISALANALIPIVERTQQGGAFQNRLLEIFAPGVLAQQIADATSEDVDARPIEERILEAQKAGPQALVDQAQRQIAAMERLITLNESGVLNTRTLGTEQLEILRQQLDSLKAENPEAAAAVSEQIRVAEQARADAASGFTHIAAGLDHLFEITPDPTAQAKMNGQETGKEVAKVQTPLVAGITKLQEQGATQGTKLDEVAQNSAQGNALLQQIVTQQEQQQAREQTPKLEIEEASREDFINLFGEKFDEVCRSWIEQLTSALNENSLTVEASSVELSLNAAVTTEIRGDDFISQLTQALLGTGLEDKTELIIEALAPLLKRALEQDGKIGDSGSKVIDLAGGGNRTGSGGPRGASFGLGF